MSAISGLEAALSRFFLSMSSPRRLCSAQDHADSGLLQQHCDPLRLLDSVIAKQEVCGLRLSFAARRFNVASTCESLARCCRPQCFIQIPPIAILVHHNRSTAEIPDSGSVVFLLSLRPPLSRPHSFPPPPCHLPSSQRWQPKPYPPPSS